MLPYRHVVQFGVMWCGVASCGAAWLNVVRCGVMWCGVAQCNAVWGMHGYSEEYIRYNVCY